MADPKLQRHQYKKVSLSDDDQLMTNTGRIETDPKKSEKEINSKCELQLTYANFVKLKNQLQSHLKRAQTQIKESDTLNLEDHQKILSDRIKLICDDKFKKASDSLAQLADLLKNFNAKSEIDNVIKSIDLDTTSKLLDALKPYKTAIESTKKVIDELNGSLITKGVFGDVEKEIDTMKKSKTNTKYAKNNIDLTENIETGKKDVDITGFLYTSGLRLSNKNLKTECKVIGVDAHKKVYTVKYGTKTMQVKQADVCLVSDDKNPKSS
jgi:hypothetical protein